MKNEAPFPVIPMKMFESKMKSIEFKEIFYDIMNFKFEPLDRARDLYWLNPMNGGEPEIY